MINVTSFCQNVIEIYVIRDYIPLLNIYVSTFFISIIQNYKKHFRFKK